MKLMKAKTLIKEKGSEIRMLKENIKRKKYEVEIKDKDDFPIIEKREKDFMT